MVGQTEPALWRLFARPSLILSERPPEAHPSSRSCRKACGAAGACRAVRIAAQVRKQAESFAVSAAGGETGRVVRAAQAQTPPSQSHGLRSASGFGVQRTSRAGRWRSQTQQDQNHACPRAGPRLSSCALERSSHPPGSARTVRTLALSPRSDTPKYNLTPLGALLPAQCRGNHVAAEAAADSGQLAISESSRGPRLPLPPDRHLRAADWTLTGSRCRAPPPLPAVPREEDRLAHRPLSRRLRPPSRAAPASG